MWSVGIEFIIASTTSFTGTTGPITHERRGESNRHLGHQTVPGKGRTVPQNASGAFPPMDAAPMVLRVTPRNRSIPPSSLPPRFYKILDCSAPRRSLFVNPAGFE
jgi:hypothetical protein